MNVTTKQSTNFLRLSVSTRASNENVTNTTGAPYPKYDFHPGFTTLIGCCIISMMLLIYLSTEPALAYLRRNRSGSSRTSAHSTITRDRPPPPLRQSFYVKNRGGEIANSTLEKNIDSKLSSASEKCSCSLTERYPESIKSQEDAHRLETDQEHDSDSMESVTRSSTIVLLSTNTTKATGIDLKSKDYCLHSQSVV